MPGRVLDNGLGERQDSLCILYTRMIIRASLIGNLPRTLLVCRHRSNTHLTSSGKSVRIITAIWSAVYDQSFRPSPGNINADRRGFLPPRWSVRRWRRRGREAA